MRTGGVGDGRQRGVVAHGDSTCSGLGGRGWLQWGCGGVESGVKGQVKEGSPVGSEQVGARPSPQRDQGPGGDAQDQEGGIMVERRCQGD